MIPRVYGGKEKKNIREQLANKFFKQSYVEDRQHAKIERGMKG
jgi:hypothetical protein